MYSARTMKSEKTKKICGVAIGTLSLLLCREAQGQIAATQPSPIAPRVGPAATAYTALRYNEDYSYLKDPAKRADLYDPFKFIPLTEDGGTYVSLGAQYRYRYELFNGLNFGATHDDDTGFHLNRILAHADLHVGPYFRVFVQGISAMEDGENSFTPRPQDSDELDVHQLFADLKIPLGDEGTKNSATLRFGRQNLLYGSQRLISPLDWTNTRRTFEGGKGSIVLGDHTIDLFLVRPVIVEKEEPNVGDGDQAFYGLYDTIALPKFMRGAGVKLDLYGLALIQEHRAANASAAPGFGAIGVDADTYTVGVRFSGNPKPFDFDVEADYQFGKSNGGDINAYSFSMETGYTFANAPLAPRAFIGFDIASGDDDPTDPDKQTFNQLFPLGHAYFGYIDVIGRQNIIDLHPGFELTLLQDVKYAKKVALRGDYHLFWRQSDDDAVYNAAGGVQRADTGTSKKYVGSEIDLLVNWQIDRHWSSYIGYSHFFAGGFIEATGPDDDIDFVYAAVQLTF